MIGLLRGRPLRCAPGSVLLDVAGVGYEVQIPLSTFYALASREDPGAGEVVLHVHTHVREDALQLFGFATTDERAAFEQCIGVSGVGPRLALAVLSGIGADDLREAVLRGDRARLQRIPGIGRKTAERLLLELKDRYATAAGGAEAAGGPGAVPAGHPGAGSADGSLVEDAVSALVNLGYAPEVARRSVERTHARLEDDATLQRLLKESLASLVRTPSSGAGSPSPPDGPVADPVRKRTAGRAGRRAAARTEAGSARASARRREAE